MQEISLLSVYENTDSVYNECMYLGEFDNKLLLFNLVRYKYIQLEKKYLKEFDSKFWVQEEETYGVPIFPNRKVGDKISLGEEEAVIIAVAPILPPYALHFEYLVMNSKEEILKFREDGYIPDKYLE